uniref:39S ribosomal protein L30, mitochondrial isoform X2 n=1 Tax=Petromyzon marinus TaxID=7757 RepID=A0AAJ7T5D2_PETMA|nr:39S ribosomal protein L30, mitochondrial isoform X2 [Petromyzon marinus]
MIGACARTQWATVQHSLAAAATMTQRMLLGRNWALCQFARTSIVAIYKKNAQEGSKRKSKEEYAKEHNIYGGDPEQPHKLHIVRRIRSIYRRPYWEKLAIKNLGLTKGPAIEIATRTANRRGICPLLHQLQRGTDHTKEALPSGTKTD